ncbi:sensor domain-containing phosphodiesterase [Mangrovibacter yixingensis]|uniref:sensor domain-containing phosphodiesterase n=1 Tax=Mangrovibacter yixingensis TaxID=1529639 RepID=UPI001CFE99BE|nr:EAL domain-containing protein [Mangrovibacter yixingensis]
MNSWYQRNKNQWWALPAILPLFLLPFAAWCNTFTILDDGRTVIYYLPHALFMALMLIFDWAALPGIALAIIIRYFPEYGIAYTLNVILLMMVPLVLCWFGYRIFVWRRYRVIFGSLSLTFSRCLWLVLIYSSTSLVWYQLSVFLGFLDGYYSLNGAEPLNIRTLINFQSLMVGTISGMPLCYFIIRAIRNPSFCRIFWLRLKKQFHPHVNFPEILTWFFLTGLLVALMVSKPGPSSTIFNTSYTFTLLLPLMLWAAMRFGYLFITTIWGVSLIVLCRYFNHYVPDGENFALQLAITSSCWMVFSFTIALMAAMTTRQRAVFSRVRQLALIDPVFQLHNLRALTRDTSHYARSLLCFIRIPELEILGRNYGLLFRIHYKQHLGMYLRQSLRENENLYNLSGHDLVLRLNNSDDDEQRLAQLNEGIQQFRFLWDGMVFQPQTGISYCIALPPVNHLPLLLGELSTMAELSLTTQRVEGLWDNQFNPLQEDMRKKVKIMHTLQEALEHDHFRLLVQPIQGGRGDTWYEVLLRMSGPGGKMITPDVFIPVACEFGLSSRLDFWVLEHSLAFIQRHKDCHRGIRLSINLSPASVCHNGLVREVSQQLTRFGVEPWQLVLEVTETDELSNVEQARQNLAGLQSLGCSVAIDDFGSGYASYARLKKMNADILKIDGSFIRNILTSSLDYQIVESICQLARVKRMQIVAEYIENEAICEAVKQIGVDYLQGYYIGRPEPIEKLFANDSQQQISAVEPA